MGKPSLDFFQRIQPGFDVVPSIADGTVLAATQDNGAEPGLAQPAPNRRTMCIQPTSKRLEADGQHLLVASAGSVPTLCADSGHGRSSETTARLRAQVPTTFPCVLPVLSHTTDQQHWHLPDAVVIVERSSRLRGGSARVGLTARAQRYPPPDERMTAERS